MLAVLVRKQTYINVLETSLLQNITLFLLFQPENNVGLYAVIVLLLFLKKKKKYIVGEALYSSLIFLKVMDFLPSLHWSEKENLRLQLFVIEGISSNTVIPARGTVLNCSYVLKLLLQTVVQNPKSVTVNVRFASSFALRSLLPQHCVRQMNYQVSELCCHVDILLPNLFSTVTSQQKCCIWFPKSQEKCWDYMRVLI